MAKRKPVWLLASLYVERHITLNDGSIISRALRSVMYKTYVAGYKAASRRHRGKA